MIVFIGVGANKTGPWGKPTATIRRALLELNRNGLCVEDASPLFNSVSYADRHEPPFVNAVARLRTTLPAEALLRRLKAIERRAGRRANPRRWAPRPLDLDILDYAGLIRHAGGSRGGRLTHGNQHFPGKWKPLSIVKMHHNHKLKYFIDSTKTCNILGTLILPHPELHRRPFVLIPLAAIAPRWHHPLTGASVGQLVKALPRGGKGAIIAVQGATSLGARSI